MSTIVLQWSTLHLEALHPSAVSLADHAQSSWTKVYEAWNKLTLLVVRGYTNHGFENWTIPCLYVAGRYLRLYAMRADEERRRTGNGTGDDANAFQDDFDPEAEENKQLEDCARQLNRIFNLCLSDRLADPHSHTRLPIN